MRTRLRMALFVLFTLPCITAAAQQQADSAAATERKMLDYEVAKPYIINDVKVSGIKYIDPHIIATTSGLNKGDTVLIPSDYLSSAIRKLWSQRYYSDVQIESEFVGDSVNLEIILTERPRVYKWNFEGVRKGEASELRDEKLKLRRGSELSDFVISSSIERIKKFYFEKGFRNVDITTRIDNDTTGKNLVDVTFVINKNKRVKIGEIEFTGNENVSDKKLRGSMKKTHQKSINFFKSARFKEKEYEEDKENLIDYYNSKGYRNATILGDSVYKINDKRIGIGMDIDEGNKFFYRNVTWTGNSVYDTEMLNKMLAINKGDTYDKKTLHKRLGIKREMNPEDMSVSSMYQNSGYLFSQIEPIETTVGEDSLDLEIKVIEGKQARINEVTISGNMRVNDEVIRRDLDVRPGDLYDRSLLMQTLHRLGQMQHFNQETLAPGIDPVSNDKVNISFPLEEVASDQFQISGGWGSDMFVGSVGVQLNNVSLKNFFKKGAWRPYPSGQNQQLAIRGQTNGSYYKALSLSFTEPWLGGRKPNSLTVGLYYSDESNAYYAWQKGTKHFRTLGASVGIGRRLSWPDRYFTIYNEIGYQAYNLKDWTSFLMENGTANILTFKTVFGRNSIDSPTYPRRGSDFSISVTLTPPYSLFDGNDYSDPNLSSKKRYTWIEYHKWNLKGEWYYPISTNNKLVLMAKAEMGYLGSYDKYKPSPFEGFDVGGDGMSGYNVYGVDIIGLRGYENSALTPYSTGENTYARAYNKYTVEMRYPFILQPRSIIYGLVFAEGGNAFSSWKDFDPFQIKRSLGVGVRLYLPVVGMVGVDWGYGFDKAVGESKRSGSQIHFMIGTQF